MQTDRISVLFLTIILVIATAPARVAAASADLGFRYTVGLSAYEVRVNERRISLARESGLESFTIENSKCFAKDFAELRTLISNRMARHQASKEAIVPSGPSISSTRKEQITIRIAERTEVIEPSTTFGRFLRELLRIVETAEGRMKWKCLK